MKNRCFKPPYSIGFFVLSQPSSPADLKFVIDHTSGKSKAEVGADELLIDSIMFRIIQISENNGKLTEQFKAEHADVPLFYGHSERFDPNKSGVLRKVTSLLRLVS